LLVGSVSWYKQKTANTQVDINRVQGIQIVDSVAWSLRMTGHTCTVYLTTICVTHVYARMWWMCVCTHYTLRKPWQALETGVHSTWLSLRKWNGLFGEIHTFLYVWWFFWIL
jgi:hypothetical protein